MKILNNRYRNVDSRPRYNFDGTPNPLGVFDVNQNYVSEWDNAAVESANNAYSSSYTNTDDGTAANNAYNSAVTAASAKKTNSTIILLALGMAALLVAAILLFKKPTNQIQPA